MDFTWYVSPVIAVALAFLVQAVKEAIPEQYHRFIPVALLFLGPAVGVCLALVMGNTWQQGIIEGVFGAAGAVYGYEFVKGIVKQIRQDD